MVSWDEAVEFCKTLSQKTGRAVSLPTEAQWEYAARGGTTGPQYDDLDAIAWYTNNSGGKMHRVGQKKPNSFGLYDMLGNVWEWCSDWYGESYYSRSTAADPDGPSSGRSRVIRGGFYIQLRCDTRVSFRNCPGPYGYGAIGLRVCREKL